MYSKKLNFLRDIVVLIDVHLNLWRKIKSVWNLECGLTAKAIVGDYFRSPTVGDFFFFCCKMNVNHQMYLEVF